MMAITSFGQKFHVADNKIDSFIETINSAPVMNNGKKFESKLITKDELKKYVEKKKVNK